MGGSIVKTPQANNVMIRASAGTGKTFQLSNRYLRLLVQGIDCQEILATTFSRKGAGEILDRVVQRLAKAALNDGAAEKLSSELDVKLSRDRAAEVLQTLMMNMHRLEIGTLDSFFNRVAKAFSLELGLPPSWEIVEEQQIDRLRVKTVQKILYNEQVPTLLHLMVKGESTRRIATLILQTVKEIYNTRRESEAEAWDRLPEPTEFFTEAEFADVVDRINNVVFAKGKQLPDHWEVVKKLVKNENWSEVAELKSLQNVLAGGIKYGSSKMTPEIIDILNTLIPHCRAWITNRLIEQNRSTCQLLGDYRDIIERTKDETGQLRFDDITERLVEFVSMWDTDRFSFRLDHNIKHLLLDEFQDTSPQQWKVIQPFAENVCCVQDSSRSFFCVGDMKQAIFGWRGGVAEIFDLANRQLAGIDEQTLSASYRSSQPVINATNQVFQNLDNFNSDNDVINEAVHSWDNWFDSHSTTKEELAGYVTVEYAEDAPASTKQAKNPQQEYTRIRNENVVIAAVERVRKILNDLRGDDGHTIGVLVRTNAEVGNMIFHLQQMGIPASEEGGNPLTDSAAVELVLAALKLADHPGDSIARFHVSHSPLANMFGLEPEVESNRSENGKAAAAGAANLRRQLIANGYGPTVESMAKRLVDQCTVRELTRLQHVVRLAYAHRSDSERWALRPSRFVNYICDEVKISDESSAQVRVMTIHKAKGLEFDSVVLPQKYVNNGWIGQVQPVIVGRKSPTDPIDTVCRYANEKHRKLLPPQVQEIFEEARKRTVRESLCVLYVAMTRAVHSLHVVLSCSSKPHDKSAAGLLLTTLCPDRDAKKSERKAGIVFETGDPRWFESKLLQAPEIEDQIEEPDDFYLSSRVDSIYRKLSTKPKSLRGLRRISPSRLEGGSRVKLIDTLKTEERELQFEAGKLVHGCFELLGWLEDGEPSKQELEEKLATMAPGSPLIEKAIELFQQSLEHENVVDVLSKSTYREQFVLPETDDDSNRLEVFSEEAFAVVLNDDESPNGEIFTQGEIDRLVLIYENHQLVAVDVIDFKSDVIDDDNLTDRIKFYRPQIETYRAAVAQTTGLEIEKVGSKLVFVRSGQVINLDIIDNSIDGQTSLRVPQKKRVRTGKTKRIDSSKAKSKSTLKKVRGPAESTDPAAPIGKVPKSKAVKTPKTKTQTQKTLWSDEVE